MNVFIFTSKPSIRKHFFPLEKARTVSCTFKSPEELQSFLKEPPSPCVLYIDISTVPDSLWRKALHAAHNTPGLRIGIVDSAGSIEDIGGLFHRGAVDYLKKPLLQAGITSRRIKDVLTFSPVDEAAQNNTTGVMNKEWKIAPGGWKEITSGQEYTFSLLYIELDMVEEWKKKSGKSHIDAIQKTFHDHTENVFSPLGGKIWMWMDHSGLVLFPFDGTSCAPLIACLRLILNRTISSIEIYQYNTLITYTMALHIGNTEFKGRGKTGGIISDTINFVFHIGKQFAEPGHLYVTDTIVPFIHKGLKDTFVRAGTFEGKEMFALRLPKRCSGSF